MFQQTQSVGPKIYLSDAFFYEESAKKELKAPAERFKNIMMQVLDRHGLILNEDSFFQGAQYSFMELCQNALGNQSLRDLVDFVVFPIASSNHDPITPGFGASFQAKYGDLDIYDVCYQGIVSSFTAIKLAVSLISNNAHYHNAYVMGIEQNTNPLPTNYEGPIPTENNLGKITVSQNYASGAYEYLESGVVHCDRLFSKIQNFLNSKKLERKKIKLILKSNHLQNNLIYELSRQFNYSTHQYSDSVNSVMQILSNKDLMSEHHEVTLILLLDCYSARCGYLGMLNPLDIK